MPIPVTSLDDRKFDDLVKEAKERLQRHLPEASQIVEGDPLNALVDMFAWMTESVIYRANLIPERQRQVFLNLLQLPLRPAVPSQGLVCVDARPQGSARLPRLLRSESAFRAGEVSFTSVGELQPLPLAMAVMLKEKIDTSELGELGISEHSLRELYNTEVQAFRPRTLVPGEDALDLSGSLDQSFYLAMYLPEPVQLPFATQLRSALAGQILNVGLAPLDDVPAERAEEVDPRNLRWEIAWRARPDDKELSYLPLEILQDSSKGGRQSGVVRLRLPKSEAVMSTQFQVDPQYAGYGNSPPEPPSDVASEQVLFWLRLRSPEEQGLALGYMGINAVDVLGQGLLTDQMIGVGNGRPNQVFSLQRKDIDAASLELQVSEHGSFVTWSQVQHLAESGPEDRVYRFDAASGVVYFGDGLRGKRPPVESRIRAARFRFGGGSASNLAAGSIKQLLGGSRDYLVRHEWPCDGGLDAESPAQAEARIPAHLSHRNRAVTKEDFATLAMDNPINPVARAEVLPGFLPGSSLGSVRENIPGVISVFVLPPADIALSAAPRPSAGLLRDVYQYLDARKLLGTELYVLSPEFIPLALSVSIQVLDPATETQTRQDVNQALQAYLWALAPGGPAKQGWPMGRKVEPNELRAVVARVEGVLSVSGLRLFHQNTENQEWVEASTVSLQRYQLPELQEVSTVVSEDQPPSPSIVEREQTTGPAPTPVPVIPDIC